MMKWVCQTKIRLRVAMTLNSIHVLPTTISLLTMTSSRETVVRNELRIKASANHLPKKLHKMKRLKMVMGPWTLTSNNLQLNSNNCHCNNNRLSIRRDQKCFCPLKTHKLKRLSPSIWLTPLLHPTQTLATQSSNNSPMLKVKKLGRCLPRPSFRLKSWKNPILRLPMFCLSHCCNTYVNLRLKYLVLSNITKSHLRSSMIGKYASTRFCPRHSLGTKCLKHLSLLVWWSWHQWSKGRSRSSNKIKILHH